MPGLALAAACADGDGTGEPSKHPSTGGCALGHRGCDGQIARTQQLHCLPGRKTSGQLALVGLSALGKRSRLKVLSTQLSTRALPSDEFAMRAVTDPDGLTSK